MHSPACCRLVIFDLDGTLLNTIEDLADAQNHALRAHGFPTHPVEAYKYFVGNGVDELLRRSLPEDSRDEETLSKVWETYNACYEKHSQDKTRPYGGIVELLGELKARGVRVAILSNKPHAYVPPLIEQYFPGLVAYAMGKQEEFPKKPDPAAVGAILGELDVAAEECIYVGDTDVDMYTGNNAGLFTVGVSWGFRTKKELKDSGAHAIIDKPQELLKYIVDKSH